MAPRLLQYLFDKFVHAIAVVVAAVLTDPAVKEAIADLIVTGVTNFVRQPNLDEHLLFANQTLGRTRDTMASKAGQDFPKVVGAFVKGMFQLAPPQTLKNGSSEEGVEKKQEEHETDESEPIKEEGNMLDDGKAKISFKPEEDEATDHSSEAVEGCFHSPSIPVLAGK